MRARTARTGSEGLRATTLRPARRVGTRRVALPFSASPRAPPAATTSPRAAPATAGPAPAAAPASGTKRPAATAPESAAKRPAPAPAPAAAASGTKRPAPAAPARAPRGQARRRLPGRPQAEAPALHEGRDGARRTGQVVSDERACCGRRAPRRLRTSTWRPAAGPRPPRAVVVLPTQGLKEYSW